MSSIASIMSLVAALSLNDKLQLNAQLAAQMAGSEVAASVAVTKKPSARKGKPAAPGTRAWSAFIEHCRATMPERFASAPPKDRMIIAKAIKDEDPEAYKAFAAKYVAEHPASETASVASDTEQAVSEPIPYVDWGSAPALAALRAEKAKKAEKAEKPEKPKRVMSDEQKAKMKAGREAAKAVKDAAKAAGETPPPKAKGKAKADAPKKAAASVGGASAPAPAPAPAAPLPQPVFEEDAGLTKITVGGDEYFLQTANNDTYAVEGDGLGAFVGRYDPATGEIDFDAEPSDE
jgi:hypothetical protein